MKTKLRRVSKRTLAMLLGVLILTSCLVVGQITTVNAARTAYKYRGDMTNWNSDTSMTTSNGGYFSYFSYKSTANASKYFRILDSSGNTLDITVITDGFWSSSGYTANDGTNNIHANGSKKGEAYIWTKTSHTVYVCVYYPNTELNTTNNPEVVAYSALPTDTPTYYVKNNFNQTSGDSTTFQETTLTQSDTKVSLTTTFYKTLTLSKASQDYKFQIVKQLGSSYKSGGNAIRKYFGMSNSTISQAYDSYNLYTDNDYCKFTSPELDNTTVTFTVTDGNWSDNSVSLKNTYPTIYTVSYTLGTHVNYSSVSGGTKTADGTIKAVSGSNVVLNVTYDSNYIYDSATSSLGGATASNSNKTFTFSSISANKSITINAKSANTPLAAPSITLGGSTSNQTVNAKRGETITLSWTAITNAGSYAIYKDDVLVTTITSTNYDIEKGNSYSGTYKVVAVPSNTTLYSNSAASNAIKLTVNKVKLSAPTVTASALEVKTGSTVTFSLTNTNTAYTEGTDYVYKHTVANGTTFSETISNLTWTTGQLASAGNYVYQVKASTAQSDYYTDSDAVSITVNASKPAWHLTGDMVTGQGGESGWPTAITTYPVDTFVSKNIFYRNVIVSGGSSTDKHYFRLTNQSNQYTVTSGSDTDMSTHTDSSSAVTASVTGTNGAMYVTGNGTFKIYVDQSTSGSPKVWVVSNEWSLTTNAYYKTFNLDTDTHNAPVAGTTGGTVSGNVEVTKGSSATLTATAASGYTFDGWYDSTDFSNKVSSSASWTFTPSGNGDYYALFKQNTPAHYTLSVANVANATVTATYNGTTLSEGSGTKSVPVGATVTVSISLNTGCQLDSTTPSGLTSGTSTFTMPASNTAVSATVSKINYALTGKTSPATYGTVEFYSNSACTSNYKITTATYGSTVYVKYTPPSAYYTLNSFTKSGSGTTTPTTPSNNISSFTMGYAATTITAKLKATTPVFNTYSAIEVNAGQSFTCTGVTLSNLTLNSTCTLSYTFNGTTNTTGTFNAPTTAGTYTLTVTASNKPAGITTAATATLDITVRVTYVQHEVTYYVDMHNNKITGVPTLSVIPSNSTTVTPRTDNSGNPCTGPLVQVGTSTVYKATVDTPVTQSGNGYSSLYFRIACTLNGKSVTKVKELNSPQISTLISSTNKEIWLEAANDASLELKTLTAVNSTVQPASGKKRIFVAKPFSWGDSNSSDHDTKWNKIAVYYWGSSTAMTWEQGAKMDYIGYDSTDGYYFYQVDVPSDVPNIIFQGFENYNTSASTHTPDVQTGNIEDIGTTNLFVLSKDGSSYKGSKMTEVNNGIAKTASFTRYYTSVKMNKNESQDVYIKPTTTDKVTYTSNNTNVVTVDANGKLTPKGKGSTTVRVKIYGTVGYLIKDHTTGSDIALSDYIYHDVNVQIADPDNFNDFNLMSLASAVTTVNIPTVSGNQPGYFDSIDSISTKVSGVANVAAGSDNGYTGSAIIDIADTYSYNGSNKPIAFTVKYAAPSSVFNVDYNSITVQVDEVSTKSIPRSGAERYGHNHWTVNGTTDNSITTTKTIKNSVETATSKNFTLTGGSTYSAIFASYSYVDVTFVYNYYEYNTQRRVVNRDANGDRIDANGKLLDDDDPDVYVYKDYYQYDKDYVGTETIGGTGWNSPPSDYNATHETEFDLSVPTHTLKTYRVEDYEVRNIVANDVTKDNIYSAVNSALKDMPDNNYYDYTLNKSSVTVTSKSPGTYKAVVTVNLTHTPKIYKIKQKAYNASSWTSITEGSATGGNYYYQEIAELTATTGYSNWFSSSSETSSSASTLGATLATGTSYKFRVTDQNTYLVTQATSKSDNQLTEADKSKRSSIAYAGREITHEPSLNDSSTDVEKLINNFYIADFFDPAQVLDPESDPNGSGTYIPYDDVKFVGGGVMYYSLDKSTGTPNQNVVENGFVNADGTADTDALKTFILERIEENKPDSTVIDDEDLSNSVAFGTNIDATIYKLYGKSTGLVYRYKPYEIYKRDGSGNLVWNYEDQKYETTISSDTFRYSNSLKAYQYIYASKAENKASNNGKDMRVYAYYIYSYTKYAKDTGVPYTEYDVVISDNYAQAETYWSNPNS